MEKISVDHIAALSAQFLLLAIQKSHPRTREYLLTYFLTLIIELMKKEQSIPIMGDTIKEFIKLIQKSKGIVP